MYASSNKEKFFKCQLFLFTDSVLLTQPLKKDKRGEERKLLFICRIPLYNAVLNDIKDGSVENGWFRCFHSISGDYDY